MIFGMKTATVNLDEIAQCARPCVLALGMFDGLHRGHRRVVARARVLAKKYGAALCVLTFSPHPSRVINMGRPPVDMLCTPERRAEMFAEAGVEKVFVKKFTKEFAEMSPEEFAVFLREKFPKLRAVVSGYNFLFGKNARGDVKKLRELARSASLDEMTLAGLTRSIAFVLEKDHLVHPDTVLARNELLLARWGMDEGAR